MKISKYTAGALAAVTLASTLFLASCGDADKDGRTPMHDNDNNESVVKDMKDGITGDKTAGLRNRGDDNHITKDSPDWANINI